jgi:hypothetical protein
VAKAFGNIKTALESMDRVTFGKHSGNTWFWVVENFPDYVIWCVGNTDMKFSYDLIVDAIKSKYKKKAAAKSEEQDLDDAANAWLFPKTAAYPSKRTAYFDGTREKNFTIADLFTKIEDKHSNGFSTRSDGFGDWDDDVPF